MPSEAGHPFSESTADIYLCSSDDVLFRLHKIILTLASDFFRDMLSLPQPPSLSYPASSNVSGPETVDGVPLLRVSEQSDVLDRLFRLCYPVDDPPLNSIHDVRTTLEAAMKYQMSEAAKITKRHLLALAATEPLRVYVLACRFGLEEEAAAAAEQVVRQKAQDQYVEDLEDIPIGAYHRLRLFCERRSRSRGVLKFTYAASHRNGQDLPSTAFNTPLVTTETLPNEPTVPKAAPYPFDIPEAEVTVETSDGVEYRVLKAIIQLSSPILIARLSALQPSTPLRLSVPEHSRIFTILFQICYPTSQPRLTDIFDISEALVAATAYEMARPSQVLREALTAYKPSGPEDAFLLYAVACRFGMRELASTAAKHTLHAKIAVSSLPELDDLGIPGGTLFRLHEYHAQCRDAVQRVLGTRDWIGADMLQQLQNCCMQGYGRNGSMPCWFQPYMDGVCEDRRWPKPEDARREEGLRRLLEPRTACCTPHSAFVAMDLSRHLASRMEAAENAVSKAVLRVVAQYHSHADMTLGAATNA